MKSKKSSAKKNKPMGDSGVDTASKKKQTRKVKRVEESDAEYDANSQEEDDLLPNLTDSDDSVVVEANREAGSSSRELQRKSVVQTSVKLTLAGIIQDVIDLAGKPSNVPAFFFNEEGDVNKVNINVFIQAVVKYAEQVHPKYWEYLNPGKGQGKGKHVVVDHNLFPPDFHFAGQSQSTGHYEVAQDELNWKKVLSISKTSSPGLKSVSKNGVPRTTKDDLHTIETAIAKVAKSSSNSGAFFGQIICSLLVKLFDGRCTTTRPSKNLREQVLGKDSILLIGYSSMKKRFDETKWRRHLALDQDDLRSFRNCIDERSTEAVLDEEVLTDEEEVECGNVVDNVGGSSKLSFKVNRLLPICTEEAIEQTKSDIESEELRESNLLELLSNSRSKIEKLREKLAELDNTLIKEKADGVVLEGVFSSLGREDYLEHAAHVPVVCRDVFEKFKTSGCATWEEFWTRCVELLNNVIPGIATPTSSSSSSNEASASATTGQSTIGHSESSATFFQQNSALNSAESSPTSAASTKKVTKPRTASAMSLGNLSEESNETSGSEDERYFRARQTGVALAMKNIVHTRKRSLSLVSKETTETISTKKKKTLEKPHMTLRSPPKPKTNSGKPKVRGPRKMLGVGTQHFTSTESVEIEQDKSANVEKGTETEEEAPQVADSNLQVLTRADQEPQENPIPGGFDENQFHPTGLSDLENDLNSNCRA